MDVTRPELDPGEFVVVALPALLRFGHMLTGSPQEAEDLVASSLITTTSYAPVTP
ncbi:MAG TPA: hypothetical protein VN969_28805 [Streptosporangiaceae bacterium]|nr:hypothetical protein [Streptosporangiaceae bacterium]